MNSNFIRRSNGNQKVEHQINDRSLWDRIWRDKDGDVVIAQWPNVWLIIWVILEVISLFVSSHLIEEVTWWAATAALAIWSLLEIFQGVNYFRRALGVCIAALTIVTIFGIGL